MNSGFVAWYVVSGLVMILFPLACALGGSTMIVASIVWTVSIIFHPLAFALLYRPRLHQAGPGDKTAQARLRRWWRVLIGGTLVVLAVYTAAAIRWPFWSWVIGLAAVFPLGFGGLAPLLAVKYPTLLHMYPAEAPVHTASLKPRRLEDLVPQGFWVIPWAVWIVGLACFFWWRPAEDAAWFGWQLTLGFHGVTGLLLLFVPAVFRLGVRGEAEPLDAGGSADLLREYESLRRFRIRGLFVMVVGMIAISTGICTLIGCKLVPLGPWLGVVGGTVGSAFGIAFGAFGIMAGSRRVRLTDRLRRPVLVLFVVLLGLDGRALAHDVQVLDNGLTLILHPIRPADSVAIETLYDVGFVDEPSARTQATHLLEHVVCRAATASYRPGESMDLLNRIGLGNAETLPDLTHYDYVVPATKLELALRIEAERLTSLRITPEIIKAESPRCYAETDSVERNPQSGMAKHAFMAFSQAWRHGEKHALVRGGLETITPGELTKFYKATYRPDRLTVVLVGGFEPAQAEAMVRQSLGTVSKRPPQSRTPIDWKRAPADTTVTWDGRVRAVCLYFPPPDDPDQRFLLSLLGTVLFPEMTNDDSLKSMAEMVLVTSAVWGVGELPFFVYATAKPQKPLDQVQRSLSKRLQQVLAEPLEPRLAVMRQVAEQLARAGDDTTTDHVRLLANTMAKQLGIPREKAIQMVLGQTALNLGIAHRLLGSAPKTRLAAVHRFTTDNLKALVAQTLDASGTRVIRVVLKP
jgi:predicted Zn-dependent peptidase